MTKETQQDIRDIIWKAINAHFILNNGVTLNANLKYVKNQTIAQVMAIGLCNQYQLDREDTEAILCVDPLSYDNTLTTFIKLTRQSVSGTQLELIDWKRRLSMCMRYVRRNYKTHYNV